MPSTDRTTRLKAKVISKACYGGGYLPQVRPNMERCRLYTEIMKKTEGEPEIIRRAKTLTHLFDKMTIYIQDDELIVGNNTPTPNDLYLSPEINIVPVQEVIEEKWFTDEENKELQEIIDYWKNNGLNMRQYVEERMTEHELEVIEHGSPVLSVTHRDGGMHCVPDWGYVYSDGLEVIIKRIEDSLKEEKDEKRINLYKSMLITYAAMARELAEKAEEPRKAELLNIAAICDRVLRKTPVTLQEGIQGFFFVHLALCYIDRAGFGCLARPDQMWFDAYEMDKKENGLTRAQAQELLECVWIKMIDLGYWFPKKRRSHFEGNSLLQTLTVAGVKKDGTDACNELTEIVLDSVRTTRNNQPTFNFRYHPNVKESALEAAIKVVKTGMGMPAFLNDEIMTYSLTNQGIPLEEARNWGVVACVSAAPCSVQCTTKRLAQSSITAKSFELLLYNGKCPCCGKQLGAETGDVTKMEWKELLEAFRLQVKHAFELGVHVRNISHEYEHKYLQRPLASALHQSPIKVGKDVAEYEDYPNNWMNCVGVVDTIDSFAVLKKMVYEDKKYTMEQMLEMLAKDWEGHEVDRQLCINKVPKFGNDDDWCDEIAGEVFDIVALEAHKVKDSNNGGGFRILPQSVSWYVSIGKHVGALPSGRKAKLFLADGGASPYHGMDKNGPTAVLSSVGKLHHKLTKGVLLNQRFMPEALDGDEGMERFKAYIKSFNDQGCSQIQFNVVSNTTLIAAQKNPELYADLIVRVAGYSAYFTQLSKDVQDAIIARHAQKW